MIGDLAVLDKLPRILAIDLGLKQCGWCIRSYDSFRHGRWDTAGDYSHLVEHLLDAVKEAAPDIVVSDTFLPTVNAHLRRVCEEDLHVPYLEVSTSVLLKYVRKIVSRWGGARTIITT